MAPPTKRAGQQQQQQTTTHDIKYIASSEVVTIRTKQAKKKK